MNEPRPKRSRTKTILIGLASVFGVGALALLWWAFGPRGNGIPVGPETTVLDGPLDEAGYVDYADAIFGPELPPGENAALPLLKAFAADIASELGPAGFAEAAEQVGLGEGERAVQTLSDERRLELIREAASRPSFRLRLTYDPMKLATHAPLAGQRRSAARLLSAAALAALSRSEFDAAADDIDSTFRLARLHNRGPSLIEAQMSEAVWAIAQDTEAMLLRQLPTADAVRRRRAGMRDREPLAATAAALRTGQRFRLLGGFQDIDRTARGLTVDPDGFALNPLGPITGRAGRLIARRFDAGFASRLANEQFDAVLAVLEASPAERPALLDAAYKASIVRTPTGFQMVGMVLDSKAVPRMMLQIGSAAYGSSVESALRQRTTEVLNDVVAAGRLFELEKGRPPAGNHDLVPAYLAGWPVDPATGDPLRTKTADGVWWVFGTTEGAESFGATFGP